MPILVLRRRIVDLGKLQVRRILFKFRRKMRISEDDRLTEKNIRVELHRNVRGV